VKRPPRLVTRTMAVTFITVAEILSVVFTILLVAAAEMLGVQDVAS
jgi:hypothetical protein